VSLSLDWGRVGQGVAACMAAQARTGRQRWAGRAGGEGGGWTPDSSGGCGAVYQPGRLKREADA
jgi:hypothetical protein